MTADEILARYQDTTNRIPQVTSDVVTLTQQISNLITNFFGQLESYMPYTQNITDIPEVNIDNAELIELETACRDKIRDIKGAMDALSVDIGNISLDHVSIPDTDRFLSLLNDLSIEEPRDMEMPITPSASIPPIVHLTPPDISIGPAPQINTKDSDTFTPTQIDTTRVETQISELLSSLRSLPTIANSLVIPDFIYTRYYDYIKDMVITETDQIKTRLNELVQTFYNRELTDGGNILDNTLENSIFDSERELKIMEREDKITGILHDCSMRGWHTPDGVATSNISKLFADNAIEEAKKSDTVRELSIKYSLESYKKTLGNYIKAHELLFDITAYVYSIEMRVEVMNYTYMLRVMGLLLDVFSENLKGILTTLRKYIIYIRNIQLYLDYVKSGVTKEIITLLPEKQRLQVDKLSSDYLSKQIERYNLQVNDFKNTIDAQVRLLTHFAIEADYKGLKSLVCQLKNRKLTEDVNYDINKMRANGIYNEGVSRKNRLIMGTTQGIMTLLEQILRDYNTYIQELLSEKGVERSNMSVTLQNIDRSFDYLSQDLNITREIGAYYRNKSRVELTKEAQDFDKTLMMTLHSVSLDSMEATRNFISKVIAKRSEGVLTSRYLSNEVESLLSSLTTIVSLTNRLLEDL
jgi:hypothetical protein